jgi:hypothetical protein
MISFSSKDIRYLEKMANQISKFSFIDPLLIESLQKNIRAIKELSKGEPMSKAEEELNSNLNKLQERLCDRTPAPRLSPEQLNAIDLLILGKTDKEVAETIGVGRNTISKWHKNAFFIAELNVKREELWADAKLRLKSLAYESVNILTNGLHSSDEKIAITSAVHVLKTVGLYDGEWKNSIRTPKTAEEVVWDQTVKRYTRDYAQVRPDAFTDWSTREWTEKVGTSLAAKYMDDSYELAVEEQKKELREYKRKAKAQLPQVEPVPLTIEEDLSQGDRPEPIKA